MQRRLLFQLPDRVFSCSTLEEFNLTATTKRNEIVAPRSICLPNLKKLHLQFVRFKDPSVVEMLNSGCPVLEDFSLSCCPLGSFKISSETLKILSITDCKYDEIHVSAPNVRSLRLTVSGKVQLEGMPFLVSAWVYLCDDGVYSLVQVGYDLAAALNSAQHLELFRFNLFLQVKICMLFTAMLHCTILSYLTLCCLMHVKDMMGNSAHEPPSFGKLKTLYIGEWRVTDLTSMAHLLTSFNMLLVWLLLLWTSGR
jgi:hypothetical protein